MPWQPSPETIRAMDPMGFNSMSEELARLRAERDALLAALKDVVDDVLDYERSNNLSPNPGRKYCWDSVARARAAIQMVEGSKAKAAASPKASGG